MGRAMTRQARPFRRGSNFKRQPNDLYQTPPAPIDALAQHIDFRGLRVWEPACGTCRMLDRLEYHGAKVYGSDIRNYRRARQSAVLDFLSWDQDAWRVPHRFPNIITNPPYGVGGKTATAFIERGLEILRLHRRAAPDFRIDQKPVLPSIMALLLPSDFDQAATRAYLFRDCPEFTLQIKLLERIVWFKRLPGEDHHPANNHVWCIWKSAPRQGAPTISYSGHQNEILADLSLTDGLVDRRMAPFASPRIEGKMVERRQYQTEIFKPANITRPDLLK